MERMRESMAQLTPRFSANRSVREYTEQHYLPAAGAYRSRMANDCAVGKQIVHWQRSLEEKWPMLHFGELKVEARGEHHVFEAQLFLNDLDPKAVRVELYAEGTMGGTPVHQEMELARPRAGGPRGETYRASVPADRPATDYTARAIPNYPEVTVPLEANAILWQR
jgi:starch phosphorylase